MRKIYTLEEGKYMIECTDGKMQALRYGEPWRDLTGDKLIGALLNEIDRMTEDATYITKVARDA